MITDAGKSIIGKYLLGQAPAYASYIAIGCGPTPLDTADDQGDFSDKTNLDFEMFRVPISSRGFVKESGIDKIVLTAELPTEERYEISEVGLYSAGSNPSAGAYDSKTVFAFTAGENWQHHTVSAATAIDTFTAPLDDPEDDNVIAVADTVFQTNADNAIFFKTSRASRYERCRFLNNIILIQGDDANLSEVVSVSNAVGTGTVVTYTTALSHTLSVGDSVTITGVSPGAYNLSGVTVASVPTSTTFTVANSATGLYSSGGSINVNHFIVNAGSNHIHLTSPQVDFSRNSPKDELRLAFSLVSKNGSSSAIPDTIRVLVDFSSTDAGSGEFARFEAEINYVDSGTTESGQDFETNRYFIVSKELQELYTTANFTWDAVTVVKIYASVVDGGNPSADYYIALDALRLENTQTLNPLYGLTGYSIVKNDNAETIIKSPNTSNYVEFRFTVGVS
jgi:hypothetical protein